jgi:hypothetical protein
MGDSSLPPELQPLYLYDPEKDDRDSWRLYHHKALVSGGKDHTPWQRSYTNMIPKTRDEGRRGCQRDSDYHFHETLSHPFHQYQMYLDDGGRRRYVHTDTRDEQFYAYLQPGLQLEEDNWTTTSGQANHLLSEVKPIGTGTRQLTLDHTAWTRP